MMEGKKPCNSNKYPEGLTNPTRGFKTKTTGRETFVQMMLRKQG